MFKKIIITVLVLVTILSLSACGQVKSYPYGPVSGGAQANDAVSNNGAYVVQKGDYIYFINSSEPTSTENLFNGSTEGALMRADKDGSNAVVILPKLVTNSSGAGLTIISDRIYFTSPADTIDSKGNVEKSYLDILSVKLDGTDAKKHSTLASTSYDINFMQSNGKAFAVWVGKSNKVNAIDLSRDKAESFTVLENYETVKFVGDEIFYTAPAVIDAESKVFDRFSNMYKMAVDGQAVEIMTGDTSSNIKYKLAILKVEDGKIFFTKEDSVVAVTCETFMSDLNGQNVVKISTQKLNETGVLAYGDGFIISSDKGTAYVGKDKSITVITTGVMALDFVLDNFMYYTNTTESKTSLYRVDMTKVIAGEETSPVQVLLYKDATTDEDGKEVKALFDTADTSNFNAFEVIGDSVFYFSNSQDENSQLWSWNTKTAKFKKVSLA